MASMRQRNAWLVVAVGSLMAGVVGCGHRPDAGKAGTWVVAIDRSGSAIQTDRAVGMLDQLDVALAKAGRAGATLDVWAFDHDAVRLWGPSRAAKTFDAVKSSLMADAGRGRQGTLPGRLIDQLADDRALGDAVAKTGTLRLMVLTDGGADDAADRTRLKDACRRLARRYPGAVVRVCGVRPDQRAHWDAAGTAFDDYRSASDLDAIDTLRNAGGAGR